ncbi:MAG: hypothetical protein ACYTEP_00895 [Planctomycetota bacterium]
MLPVTLSLLTFLTGSDPVGGGEGAKELAAAAQVELNPFGTWLTVITWCALVGINLWCFRKVLRRPTD